MSIILTQAQTDAGSFTWKILSTLTFAGDTTKTTAPLQTFKMYMIVFNGFVGDATNHFLLRFNGDTAANYASTTINGTTITQTLSQTSIDLGLGTNDDAMTAVLYVQGKTASQASGRVQVYGMLGLAPWDAQARQSLGGTWAGGNGTQITTMTVLTAGVATGTVRIYGRD